MESPSPRWDPPRHRTGRLAHAVDDGHRGAGPSSAVPAAGGLAPRPGGHHTLRHAVEWSYDLLDDREKALFARCSVFAGEFDLAQCLLWGLIRYSGRLRLPPAARCPGAKTVAGRGLVLGGDPGLRCWRRSASLPRNNSSPAAKHPRSGGAIRASRRSAKPTSWRGCPTALPGCRLRAARSTASARPESRMLRRGRRVVPRRTGESSPASSTRVRPEDRSATSSDLRTRASSRIQGGEVVMNVKVSCYGAGTVQVEPTGEHRTPIEQRLFPVVEQVVGPSDGVAQRVVAFQSAPRAHQQPEALIEPIAHLAGGHGRHLRRPVRWRAGSRRGGGRFPPPRPPRHRRRPVKRGDTCCARSTNKATAAESTPAPTSSEGTGHSRSSAMPVLRGWWPQSWSPPRPPSMASIRSAAASSTCSQLSSTSSRTLPSRAAATLSATLRAGLLGDAQHHSHRVGHRSGIAYCGQLEKPHPVREFVDQPPRHFQRQPGLADPPTPVSVTNRWVFTAACTSPASDSRPIKLVSTGRRFPDSPPAPAGSGTPCVTLLLVPGTPEPGSADPQPSRSQIDEINAAEQTRRRLGQQD